MVDIAANSEDVGITKLFSLLNENLQFSDTTKGTIHLSLKWTYNPAFDAERDVKRRSAFDMFRKAMKGISKGFSSTVGAVVSVVFIDLIARRCLSSVSNVQNTYCSIFLFIVLTEVFTLMSSS